MFHFNFHIFSYRKYIELWGASYIPEKMVYIFLSQTYFEKGKIKKPDIYIYLKQIGKRLLE